MSGYRLSSGARIDRRRTLRFTFDGRRFEGFEGDTLASALIANGVTLFGRSFKYHRPRGVITAGPEEPCALVELGVGAHREPNTPATIVELVDGIAALSQNRWPSLAFDMMSIAGLASRFMPAGFYYKTFMRPASFWEKVYEPLIRRAAGLGRIADGSDPDRYEHRHRHCDLLVVGSGPAGLAAARVASRAGARTILVEQDFEFGGGYLVEPEHEENRAALVAELANFQHVTLMRRASVVGAYDGGVFAAVERVAKLSQGSARQTLHIIRARRAILATGAVERIVAFANNDRPGVMLASAARAYANRWGVAVGRRVALFVNNDEAYSTAHDLSRLGVEIAAIVDVRAQSAAAEAATKAGLPVRLTHEVCGTGYGRAGLSGVHVRRVGASGAEFIAADALCVSGGHSPQMQLASQARAKAEWRDDIAAFVPNDEGDERSAGAARGVFGLAAASGDGARAASETLRSLGFDPGDLPTTAGGEDQIQSSTAPVREVRGKGKAFVDLQNDVTSDDIRLAHREGYAHIEHVKRYTTLSMATDQGKIGGLTGAAALADAREESIAAVGLPTFRPYAQPATWGALAGADVGAHFKPKRLLPLHDWHERNGAVFVRIGLWMRPLVYSQTGDTSWGPVLEEARAVRRSVGVTDMSSLGKINVEGPDAAAFLDRVYANTFSNLAVGRARYGLMLREDGIALDDGTTSRLAEDHFLVTTTTQKIADVLDHMEWHLQTVWPELDVSLSDVSDHWAQFAIAGPYARRVVARIAEGVKLSNEALPFMGVAEAKVAGVNGRLFRISFSGEIAYEIAVPAGYAEHAWNAILSAGAEFGIRPYGLDALNVLRIEKGHITGGEINGQTTANDLGLGRMLKKSNDFVGAVLSQRPGLLDKERLRLVGVSAIDPSLRLRGGAHLVASQDATATQGYITAACMAAEGEGWIGLALLANGHDRHGETLVAASPVYGENVAVRIGSPHRIDPENHRVRA